MKRKYVKILAGFLVVSLLIFILDTLYSAGTFKSLTPHVEGQVKTVYRSMYGTEDMDIDYNKGLLYVSSTDRWKEMKGEPAEAGIYRLQLDSGTVPQKLTTTYAGTFRPHGISFLSKADADYLFVVNHNKEGNFVELFKIEDDTLVHQKTFSDPLLVSPNDVVGVDINQFYVTIDHGTKKGMMRTLEDYLRIPWSYLVYYNGTEYASIYEGLTYGNGVNISRDKSKLYLSQTTGRELLTFSRNQETGAIRLENKLALNSGLDNIHVDEEDNLWIGAHPQMLKFVDHAKDSTKKSPSQVFKITPRNSYLVQEMYLNGGEELSGSSVAVHYKNDMLVGVVFENKVLRISLNKP